MWFFLCSLAASAVGLGSIEVLSGFNQPFRARIPLDIDEAEVDRIRVHLGSGKDFSRVGLRLTPAIRQLRFAVENESGSYYITIAGRDRQREPVMDFLLRIETHGGQLLRRYQVPMDYQNAGSPP